MAANQTKEISEFITIGGVIQLLKRNKVRNRHRDKEIKRMKVEFGSRGLKRDFSPSHSLFSLV